MPRSPVPPRGPGFALTRPLWRPDADGSCGFGARLPYAKGGGVRGIENGAQLGTGQGSEVAEALKRLGDAPVECAKGLGAPESARLVEDHDSIIPHVRNLLSRPQTDPSCARVGEWQAGAVTV